MTDYKCENAIRKDEYLFCKKLDDLCGNSYFCRMGNRFKLNENSVNCPVKNKEKEEVKPIVKKRAKNNE